MAIRSGRFKSKDVSGANKLTVVVSTKDGGIYRFFNSGKHGFKIGDGTNEFDLESTHSIDIGVKQVELKISTTAAQEIEGIYDILTTERSVRSGRFKVKASTGSPAGAHTVISLDNNNELNGKFYRFFNSGDEGDPSDATTAATIVIEGFGSSIELKPGLSVDIQIDKNQTIIVKGLNNDLSIEGIYEFLG